MLPLLPSLPLTAPVPPPRLPGSDNIMMMMEMMTPCQHHVTEHPATELAQDLLSTITRSCSWAHHGCGYTGALADLETHEPGCVFQEVECWVCGSSPSLANFHNHSPDLGCYQGATIHNAVGGNITVAMSVASGPSGNPFILGSFLVEIGQKLGEN